MGNFKASLMSTVVNRNLKQLNIRDIIYSIWLIWDKFTILCGGSEDKFSIVGFDGH